MVWTVVIFGALFVLDLARAYQRKRQVSWWELVFPVTVAASTARLLKGSTLYPVVDGKVDSTQAGVHAAAGVGVYVILVGAVVCALGIWAMRQRAGRQLRQCPACAENVLAEAKRCKHCGERLDEVSAA